MGGSATTLTLTLTLTPTPRRPDDQKARDETPPLSFTGWPSALAPACRSGVGIYM